ncbi:hypothetical protein ScPMuIL_014560 [Solemya velum]
MRNLFEGRRMSSETALDHDYGQRLAPPLHVQQVAEALRLDPFLNYVENLINVPVVDSDCESGTDGESDLIRPCSKDPEGTKFLNGISITKAERRADKTRLYNFSKVKRSRKWLKNILLSDSSSDEDEERPITKEELHTMLKTHKYQRKHQMQFYQDTELHQYQYYSTGLLSNYDKYHEHQKAILGPKRKISREQKKLEKKMKAKLKKLKKERIFENGDEEALSELDPAILEAFIAHRQQMAAKAGKHKKLTPEQADAKRRRLWISIAKKEIPKAQKQKVAARKEMMQSLRKISHQCMKECKRAAVQSQKTMKETPSRAKRVTREMLLYWKRFEKVEKEHRKRAEKEAQEQRKMDLELREARRQQRKLNFLITQTELYAHFMSRKLTGETEVSRDRILSQLEEGRSKSQFEVEGGVLHDLAGDNYDSEVMKKVALKNAEEAYISHRMKTQVFDDGPKFSASAMSSSLANPLMPSDATENPQPSIFEGKLKAYQLKGMNWLASLYNQGINGILADEMGLGKTVQSVAFLAHLAEVQGIWGPFLIIAPASTLHNWQQEVSRFTPRFKVVPYWGNTQDRRILRKFWDQKCLHTEEASFHVVVTSYQLVIQDVKYFQRIKWQYLILDEAQAIKSSSSARWKILLGFNCRNRLLLSGTPIQNSMAELWALLHFIMPTLFDSHDEFAEWFSKDIESHAERHSGIDENQLSRLHMILKPFMLRRVKKDVENELSDKIEILMYCPLTTRQKLLYQAIKNKISIEDLVNSSASTSQSQLTTSSLMNIVMQFRKVCNHPELFERREARSPLFLETETFVMPKLLFREGILEVAVPNKKHILYSSLYIHSPAHVHTSLSSSKTDHHVNSCFSFLRFINMSPADLHSHMSGGLLVRWLALFLWLKEAYRLHHLAQWTEPSSHRSFCLNQNSFLLSPCRTTYFPNVNKSATLSPLVFTSFQTPVYCHSDTTIHYMAETQAHRRMRLRHLKAKMTAKRNPLSPSLSPTMNVKKNPLSPPHSPTKSPSKSGYAEHLELPPYHHKLRPSRHLHTQPCLLPRFLFSTVAKVHSRSRSWYCEDRSAAWQRLSESLCARWWNPWCFHTIRSGGLRGIHPPTGWSGIYVPDKETLVTDAGKLNVLDRLLDRLKREGHRVLIYSQMTRMINLLEEYMWHRKHTYMRLDGSSKISDRRDMVADFQARSDIFVFLLSTRAGGLGINLTAADTVIFYDSDWNPTVDQQAMDRAHRLGQTKQVTVYRLVCKGSIEERIIQRAKEKSEIQRMVISGGNFRPDTLKPKEVVSLLIDDDEMEKKLKAKQEERKDKDDGGKEKDRKRKRDTYVKKKDSKKSKLDETNVTIPAFDTESVASLDSTSVPASPQSVMSVGSEANPQLAQLGADDSSNDGLVIVDDSHPTFPPVTQNTPSKRGRGRGRPKGSTMGRRTRGRGSAKKALSAAEIAGAQAGMTAAYAAYGYNFKGTPGSSSSKEPSTQAISKTASVDSKSVT